MLREQRFPQSARLLSPGSAASGDNSLLELEFGKAVVPSALIDNIARSGIAKLPFFAPDDIPADEYPQYQGNDNLR